MILVNNPGSWAPGLRYPPLDHANWNGWTPTDLIFPFFLFIVGVAMTFSFEKRLAKGQNKIRIFEQVCRRSIILFLLGLILAGFPRWRLIAPYIAFIIGLGFLFADEPPFGFGKTVKANIMKIIAWILLIGSIVYFIIDFQHFQTDKPIIRIPGVLQRIAVCYFITAIIMFFTKVRGRIIWAIALIIIYWLIMKLCSAPATYSPDIAHPEGLLNDWIDIKVLGHHIYSERPDPEGLISTLPAIATTLLGVLCGNWLHTSKSKLDKLIGLFFMGNILLFVGICMDAGFPINKKIWSSSYVVFTAGMALHFLGMCFYLLDVLGVKKWAYPFLVYGTNPIFVFFASGILGRIMYRIKIPVDVDKTLNLKAWIYENLFTTWASPINASLCFAIAYIFFWFLIMVPLYQKRIFIKI